MTNEERDLEFDIVFDGKQELIGERLTKLGGVWQTDQPQAKQKRQYNKKSSYWKGKQKHGN